MNSKNEKMVARVLDILAKQKLEYGYLQAYDSKGNVVLVIFPTIKITSTEDLKNYAVKTKEILTSLKEIL